ncbi:MAG TPA: SAM-dependent methyltransferase [Devosiaceae bacterium]|jgi:methyltransferase (TIGR00027 family)
MQDAQPSRTALAAAMYRAAHQRLEQGRIFRDELALPIIGADAQAHLDAWAERKGRGMRIFIAARSRFAGDKLAEAVAAGTRQVVIVGAGLDTTALRNHNPDLRCFEVDHPATQAWKRERIAEAALAIPQTLTFAPVDFERETLAGGLAKAGFDAMAPAFFIWLGVVPYLTEGAIFATLGFVATVPSAGIVFDYANPAEQYEGELRVFHERRAAGAAAIGEPWLSFFDSDDLAMRLRDLGALVIEDMGPQGLRDWLGGPSDTPAPRHGGHILYANWPA